MTVGLIHLVSLMMPLLNFLSEIVGLITEDETKYPAYLDEFITWCDASFLKLNTKVTKETYSDVALVVLGCKSI